MPFPILFTIDNTSRHEVLYFKDVPDLSSLETSIAKVATTSPNCAEFMAKYKKQSEDADAIKEIKVRWSTAGRDSRIWPISTSLTPDNCEAVLGLMDRGRDALEVTYKEPAK